MAERHSKPVEVDPVWERIKSDARDTLAGEPLLGGMVHSSVLHHDSLERALAYRFALKLASAEMSPQLMREKQADLWLGFDVCIVRGFNESCSFGLFISFGNAVIVGLDRRRSF